MNKEYTTQIVIEGGKEYKVRIYDNDCALWLLNGNQHREKGPSFMYDNGTMSWSQNGVSHRLDGPAEIVLVDQARANRKYWEYKKYWRINGTTITEQKHIKIRIMLAFGLDSI